MNTEAHAQEICHVRIGVMMPQAKKLLEARIKAWNRSFLAPSEGACHCQHLDLGFLSSRTVRRKLPVVLNYPVVILCYTALANKDSG